MLFNSVDFAIFFAATYALYLCLPHRPQNALLLVASYFFYGYWDARFLGLVALSTVVNYVAALRIHAARSRGAARTARGWLMTSVGVDLGLLGLFKYYDFFARGLEAILTQIGFEATPLVLELVLPVGISFYTFQTIAYSVDVFRGKATPIRRFFDFALYVAFFPQLMAGPIERARDLAPQIQNPRRITKDQLGFGAWLLFWGLFKKVFISDNVYRFTRWGLLAGGAQTASDVYLLSVAFAIRLYCDFSGYSDMARGMAKLLGIELSPNFALPFLATSPAELWRRWHMTLTLWLTDYVYLPVRRRLMDRGLSREHAIHVAIMVTFLAMGFWHGAKWSFLVWGGAWGLILVIQRRYERAGRALARVPVAIRRVLVFHLFAFSLLLIVGPLSAAAHVASVALQGPIASLATIPHAASLLFFAWPLAAVEFLQHRHGSERVYERWTTGMRASVYATLATLLLCSGATTGTEFIYFQF